MGVVFSDLADRISVLVLESLFRLRYTGADQSQCCRAAGLSRQQRWHECLMFVICMPNYGKSQQSFRA